MGCGHVFDANVSKEVDRVEILEKFVITLINITHTNNYYFY